MQQAREDARRPYERARDEFEKLETKDKAAFVLEATFATLGQALEDVGRVAAEVFEQAAGLGAEAEPDEG